MARPQLYINVSQTMTVGLIGTVVLSYIFDFKRFRTDINELFANMAQVNRR